MLEPIELNNIDLSRFDGPVYIYIPTGESLLYYGFKDDQHNFINPDTLRSYKCPGNYMLLNLEIYPYWAHCFSTGLQGNLHFFMGAMNLPEISQRIQSIADKFNSHTGEAKGIYVMDADSQQCNVCENSIEAAIKELQRLSQPNQFRPSPINANQLSNGNTTNHTDSNTQLKKSR